MKKYIVKSTMHATEENDNFKGAVHTYYHGANNELLGAYGDEYLKMELTPWWINRYGYNRLCDARRCYSYTHPENTKWWNTEVEIVTVDV